MPAGFDTEIFIRMSILGCQQTAATIACTHLLRYCTDEHKIPQNRELVDDIERHLYAQRNFQNGA